MQRALLKRVTPDSVDGFNIELDIKPEYLTSIVGKIGTSNNASVISVVLSGDNYSALIKTSSKNIAEVMNNLFCHETDTQKPVYKQTNITFPIKKKNKSRAGEEFSYSKVNGLEINQKLIPGITQQIEVREKLLSYLDEKVKNELPQTIVKTSNSTRFYRWLQVNKSMIPVKFRLMIAVYEDPKKKKDRRLVTIEN